MWSGFESSVENDRDFEGISISRRMPSIPSLFEAAALSHPEATALSIGPIRLNYADLNRRANHLAHRLLSLGVSESSIVGVCMERSPELYIGLLAVLKAGAAYLPLDPESPPRRLSLMLQDTKAATLLVHPPSLARIAALDPCVPWISVEISGEITGIKSNPSIDVSPDDLAYVMYTSGSSGTPKGVRIPHRGVARLVRETNYCEFGPGEVFLQLAPISFDASTFEIWGPLLNGGRLAIMPPGLPSLDQIGAAIKSEGVTTLWLTAALFHLMVDQRPDDLKGLRQLLAGGDVLSPSHVRKALSILDQGVVINGYGPTETTTFACCHRISCPEQIGERVPIGLPICKTTLHILDDNFAPRPAGEIGELWIGGQGVGLGYLNDPDLTRRKFFADPFSKQPNARLYRTGDLARKRSDGVYEFLGRIDEQVKILGHRVEPAEIEKTLMNHPNVRAAAVIPLVDNRGEKRLAAYVVSDHPIDGLKAYLAEILPAAWIPSSLIRVDSFPLNSNGKIDRAALPRPNPQAMSPGTNIAEIDPRIIPIWEKALGVEVGPDNNFFDLGGDSLLLIEVHSELQKTLGRDISLMALFEYPTARAIAGHLFREATAEARFDEVNQRAVQQKEAMARSRALRAGSIHD